MRKVAVIILLYEKKNEAVEIDSLVCVSFNFYLSPS